MGPLSGARTLCQKALATAKKVVSLAEALQTLKHEEQRPQTEHAVELKKTFGRSTGKAQQLVASWRNLVSKGRDQGMCRKLHSSSSAKRRPRSWLCGRNLRWKPSAIVFEQLVTC
jgi:hypothetical protein